MALLRKPKIKDRRSVLLPIWMESPKYQLNSIISSLRRNLKSNNPLKHSHEDFIFVEGGRHQQKSQLLQMGRNLLEPIT